MTFRFRALVEDKGHEALLRGLLDRSGSSRNLHIVPPPNGRGAGEQHVRKHLPAFVKDLLIPTRNGETWAWCLLGNEVDETTDFKPRLAEINLRKTFGDRWLPVRPSEPPSLVAGRSEWARLP